MMGPKDFSPAPYIHTLQNQIRGTRLSEYPFIKFFAEKTEGVTSGVLSLIHRLVCILNQDDYFLAVTRCDRDSHTDTDRDLMSFNLERMR